MADTSRISGLLSQINDEIDSASGALDDLNKKALEGDLGFHKLIGSIKTSTTALTNLTKAAGLVGSKITGGLDLGLIGKGADFLASSFENVIGAGLEIVRTFDSIGRGVDSVTGYSRGLNASLYDTVARFNGSFDAAKKYSDYITSTAQDFATAEFGFIAPADRIGAIKALAEAGIPLEHLNDTIQSSAGNMDLLNTSFLHSKALGLDMRTYMGGISEAMLTQGLNSQEAAEQMAMFGDVSRDTGIRTDKIAGQLNSMAKEFSTLGITASFGEPILKGFATTLSDMGLGFENALDLSGKLSKSLAGLTSNYAAAYVTFQRGGLDIGGGGGALGASIGLRAEALKEERGEGQGDLGLKLANAMKDTLASFAGGQIVTVEEAAANPQLENAFYTQTQLLQSLYNISDTGTQDRTLDLLERLGEATASGNKDLAQSLGNDLQEVVGARSATLSYEEKIAQYTEASFAELQFLNKNLIDAFRLSNDTLSANMAEMQAAGVERFKESTGPMRDVDPTKPLFDVSQMKGELIDNTQLAYNKLSKDINRLSENQYKEMLLSLGKITMKVSNEAADQKIGEMIDLLKTVLLGDTTKKYGRTKTPISGQ